MQPVKDPQTGKVVIDPGTGKPVMKTVETRTVTLNVDVMSNLRDQQILNVSWTGAHPSGLTVPNPSGEFSNRTEYPVVLMQCRGQGDQVTPQSCWNPYPYSRGIGSGHASDGATLYPPWRLDANAGSADRLQYSALPSGQVGPCSSSDDAEHHLPFLAADGRAYYGPFTCNGTPLPSPPEAGVTEVQGSTLPDNAMFSPTRPDGSGDGQFSVRTSASNASLGCSVTVACSLVAVPVIGISCDAGAGLPVADQPKPNSTNPHMPEDVEVQCDYGTGSPWPSGDPLKATVSGQLWWSASNWMNRIVMPLTFSPPDNLCDLVTTKPPAQIFGSELLVQATTLWAPALCIGAKASPIKHIQTAEPFAQRLLLSGTAQATFSSQPPPNGFATPTVQAPTAFGGFAIAYAIDANNKLPYRSLKLTPRLLAKLMTSSYLPVNGLGGDFGSEYDALPPHENTRDGSAAAAVYLSQFQKNPRSIARDPEFQALNPGIGVNLGPGTDVLQSLSTQSDVIYALSSYIGSDPDARAWLDGNPDPWGMVVNPHYIAVSLPVNQWPMLEDFTWPPDGRHMKGVVKDANGNPLDSPISPAATVCEESDAHSEPFLDAAAPFQRLLSITQAVQFAQPSAQVCNSTTSQDGSTTFYTPSRSSAQTPGSRFVIGVTSLGDARRYSLETAALQTASPTSVGKTKSGVPFVQGGSFVAPTSDSLKSAAALLKYDSASMTWQLPYDALHAADRAKNAYPGAMIVYTDVPTSGLSKDDATSYATFLNYVAGPGQVPGTSFGQLAPGFLPLTAANGLGQLSTYTRVAAQAVAAQSGVVPPLNAVPMPTPSEVPPSTSGPLPESHVDPVTLINGTPAASQPPKKAEPMVVATRPLGKTIGTGNSAVVVMIWLLLGLLLLGPVIVPIGVFASGRRRGIG